MSPGLAATAFLSQCSREIATRCQIATIKPDGFHLLAESGFGICVHCCEFVFLGFRNWGQTHINTLKCTLFAVAASRIARYFYREKSTLANDRRLIRVILEKPQNAEACTLSSQRRNDILSQLVVCVSYVWVFRKYIMFVAPLSLMMMLSFSGGRDNKFTNVLSCK